MEELNEGEKQNKMNEENQNTDIISNLYGEEEDEDDLLKSDTESNTSFKSIRQMEAKDMLDDLPKKMMIKMIIMIIMNILKIKV